MATSLQLRRQFGLCLVMFSLGLSACQTEDSSAPKAPVVLEDDVVRTGDTVAASVNGTAIYQTDVERAAVSQNLIEADDPLLPTNEIYGQVLEELIDQRLLAQEALTRALDQEDEAARRLAVAQERILGNLLVERHLADAINDDTIQETYDEQNKVRGGTYELHASHILVADEQTAKDIVAELESGVAFETLALNYSVDEATKANGGSLGYFTRDRLDSDFTKAAFALKDGEISNPFQTQFGWHIVKAHDRRRATYPSLDDIRDEVISFMTYDEIQKLLKSLRADADVSYQFGKDSSDDEPE